MAALVTVEEIKTRARVVGNHDDADLQKIANEATDIVIGYIKQPEHGWTDATVPDRIKSAILLTARAIYDGQEPLSETVKNLLHRDRDPALA